MEYSKSRDLHMKSFEIEGSNSIHWESSIPNVLKKHSNKTYSRQASLQFGNLYSVGYLKFSEKVLNEYSKKSFSTKILTKKKELPKDSFYSEDSLNNSSFYIPALNIPPKKFRYELENSSKHKLVQPKTPKKVNEIKTFSLGLPDLNKGEYLINQYSIPNKLVGIRHNVHEHKSYVGCILNPSLKIERKGVTGQKIVKLHKNVRKNIFIRIAE